MINNKITNIFKDKCDLIDFNQGQNVSYSNFFSNDSNVANNALYNFDVLCREILDFPLADDLVFKYNGFEFEKDELSDEQSSNLIQTTLTSKISVWIQLIDVKTGEVKSNKKHLICHIPRILPESGSFVVNGMRRIFVPGILRNKGILFTSQDSAEQKYPQVTCSIRPEKGLKLLMVTSKKNDSIVVKIGKNKVDVLVFLTAIYFENLSETLAAFFPVKTFDSSITDIELEAILQEKVICFDVLKDFALETEDLSSNFRDLEANYKTKVLKERKFESSSYYDIPSHYAKFFKPANYLVSVFSKQENAFFCVRNLGYFKRKFTALESVSIMTKFFSINYFKLGKLGRANINNKFGTELTDETITFEDCKNIVLELMEIHLLRKEIDDQYNITNKYVVLVGEFLNNEFKKLFTKFKQYVDTKVSSLISSGKISDFQTIQKIIEKGFNTNFITKKMLALFTQHVNSQYADQVNPLSELLHKNKIISAGKGGVNKDYASYQARNVHASYFGRICCISTPEGPNAGIVNFAASYLMLDKFGFLYTPYYRVEEGRILQDKVVYVSVIDEYKYKLVVASFTDKFGIENGRKVTSKICDKFVLVEHTKVDVIQVYPNQLFSIGASLVPFFQHNDNNRNTTAANMQRQACPLLFPEKPKVMSGFEYEAVQKSGYCIYAKDDGTVVSASSTKVVVRYANNETTTYSISAFVRSNSNTTIGHRVVVVSGQILNKGDLIADSLCSRDGYLALGVNLRTAFMSFKGLNFEDSVVVSERVVNERLLTSIVVNQFTVNVKKTNFGNEILTRNLPLTKAQLVESLDEEGLVKVGTFVEKNSILVGKLTPKVVLWFSKQTDKLWRKLVGNSVVDFQNTSLLYTDNAPGVVVNVTRSTISEGDINEIVTIWVARESHIKAGDKICGRYGNKQIISAVLPVCDMPYDSNGKHVDVVMNPLGITSRMNLGQLMEVQSNLVNEFANDTKLTDGRPYSGLTPVKILEYAKQVGLSAGGKVDLFDGLTGEKFYKSVTVGDMYILKLEHMVDLKFHARSIGPNSMLTLQPVGGKNRSGAQRCGEMEQWVLEAYGVTKTIMEKNTLLSDDMKNLENLLSIIIYGKGKFDKARSNTFLIFKDYLYALGLNLSMKDKEEVEDVK